MTTRIPTSTSKSARLSGKNHLFCTYQTGGFLSGPPLALKTSRSSVATMASIWVPRTFGDQVLEIGVTKCTEIFWNLCCMHKVQGVPFRMIMFDDIQGCLWRIQVAYPSSTTSALSMETSAASIEIQSEIWRCPHLDSILLECSISVQLHGTVESSLSTWEW